MRMLKDISGNQELIIKALDGARFFSDKKTFTSYLNGGMDDLDLNKSHIATPQTSVKVYKITADGPALSMSSPL